MRLDPPHEMPRRLPEPSQTPLEPSAFEQRREHLAARAADLRPPRHLQGKRTVLKRPREAREREIARDRSLARRTRRNEIPQKIVGLSLREEEIKAITVIGKFRVVAISDLSGSVYAGRSSELARDLRFLQQKGVVEVNSVNARRDGRGGKVQRIEVVTLTKAGREVVRQIGGLPEIQELYYGMVKPREVEHDAQIYRAYLKEIARIEKNGGTNPRVQLDFELKSKIQKAIRAERKTNPERDLAEIKRSVAARFEVPFSGGRIQIPDARIEYDLDPGAGEDIDQGSIAGHEDIEVLTAAYRPAHLRNKAQAGFRLYASGADRSALTSRIEDDHSLMEGILEL